MVFLGVIPLLLPLSNQQEKELQEEKVGVQRLCKRQRKQTSMSGSSLCDGTLFMARVQTETRRKTEIHFGGSPKKHTHNIYTSQVCLRQTFVQNAQGPSSLTG